MRFKKTDPAMPEVDMTPMIDIVFQLIAFFMFVNNFDQTQADERVKLPRDQLARPMEVARENELVYNIGFNRDKDGNKLSPEPVVFYLGEEIPVLNFGPEMLQDARIIERREGEEAIKEYTIVLRSDAEVPTGLVQEMMQFAQQAKFEKFSLKAEQKNIANVENR